MAGARRDRAAKSGTYLSVAQAAEVMNLSVAKVYDLVYRGELKASNTAKPGAKRPCWRVHRPAIDAYMESRVLLVPGR